MIPPIADVVPDILIPFDRDRLPEMRVGWEMVTGVEELGSMVRMFS